MAGVTLGGVVVDDEPKAWCEELFGAEWAELDAREVFDGLAERIGGDVLESHWARIGAALGIVFPADWAHD